MTNNKFYNLEKKYWELSRKLNLEQYFNPINIQTEKKIFIKKFENNLKYNPKFNYKIIDYNYENISLELSLLKNYFDSIEHPLSSVYINKIENDFLLLKIFNERKNNTATYPSLLTSLYGIPSLDLLCKSKYLLESIGTIEPMKESITAKEAQQIFKQELSKRKITNWMVLLNDIPASMSVNSLDKVIKISINKQFNEKKIKSLIVHEIDTHILRYLNGCQQKYKIFQYGFPNYLQTEEGLAILSEDKNKLLSNQDMVEYCCRVIGAYYADKTNFYDLFKKIYKYTNHIDLSYTIATRIKRGLIDTSLYGGYTKDQVYLKGYFKLKEFNNPTIKKLYCGKIGIEDIPLVDSLNISSKSTLPDWLNI